MTLGQFNLHGYVVCSQQCPIVQVQKWPRQTIGFKVHSPGFVRQMKQKNDEEMESRTQVGG